MKIIEKKNKKDLEELTSTRNSENKISQLDGYQLAFLLLGKKIDTRYGWGREEKTKRFTKRIHDCNVFF